MSDNTPSSSTRTLVQAMRLLSTLFALTEDGVINAAVGEAADRLERLDDLNLEMRQALIDISYILEKSRIWGGMGWHYNELHPMHVTKARDIAIAAIAKAEPR